MYDKAIDKRKEDALSIAYFEYLLKIAKIEAETLLVKAKETVAYFQKNFSDQNVRFEDEYSNDLLINLEILYNRMQILFDKAQAVDFQNYGRLRFFMEDFYKEIYDFVTLADALPPQKIEALPSFWPCDKEFNDLGFNIHYVSYLDDDQIKNLPCDTFVVKVTICVGDFDHATEYFTVKVKDLNLIETDINLFFYANYCLEDTDNVEFYWAKLEGKEYLINPRMIYKDGKEWIEVNADDDFTYIEGSFSDFGIYFGIVYFDGEQLKKIDDV